MTLFEIHELFEYDLWATDRTLQSVSSLSEPRYLEDLKSSHGGIHGTLVHIYSADLTWLQRWKGSIPSAHITTDEVPNLESLKARWKQYREELDNYLRGLAEEKLRMPFSYSDFRGNQHAEPLFHQMQHRINHSSYHRGQVVTMLRQQGGKPVATDLIVFYRERPTKPISHS